ncbi:MAG: hypothetical protein ACRCTE_11280 [Cellulosilyticaceae bacterium]
MNNKEQDINSLLDVMQELLEDGKPSFLSGNKIVIDKDEMLDCINDVRTKLPTELQQSVWIVEERNKILAEAQGDASLMLQEAQETLDRMIDQHEITKYAEERSQFIIDAARRDAREIHMGAAEYADYTVKQVELKLKSTLETIHREAQAFESFVTDIMRTLYEHRQQLKDMMHHQIGNDEQES